MKKPSICAVVVNSDIEAIQQIEPLVDLFEVRIDLIGSDWQELVKHLKKPWIGCNRHVAEGGRGDADEEARIEKLFQAVGLGAAIIDIELRTRNVKSAVELIRERAKCLLSFHDMTGTPTPDNLKEIVQQQLAAGADICKVVTTAQKFSDNLSVLQLIREFPHARVVALTMGTLGVASRILCPLIGGDFTYASIETGKESASGQVTVGELRTIYEIIAKC